MPQCLLPPKMHAHFWPDNESCFHPYPKVRLLAASRGDQTNWAYILTDVRQDSNLRYKGELNPAAFAAATRKPDRHTLWNLLAHRGERTFKHPQRSSCIHRILKFSCLITGKKLRTQKSPQLFCISSRFLISPTKRSGSVTLINGPKESTRITSSVSSSCR